MGAAVGLCRHGSPGGPCSRYVRVATEKYLHSCASSALGRRWGRVWLPRLSPCALKPCAHTHTQTHTRVPTPTRPPRPPLRAGLFADEAGLFDWTRTNVGPVALAAFAGKGKSGAVVATQAGVLASLGLKDGAVAWRHVLVEGACVRPRPVPRRVGPCAGARGRCVGCGRTCARLQRPCLLGKAVPFRCPPSRPRCPLAASAERSIVS